LSDFSTKDYFLSTFYSAGLALTSTFVLSDSLTDFSKALISLTQTTVVS